MPQDSLYGKPPRDFQKVDARKTRNFFMNWPFRKMARFHELAISRNGTGSRARTYDLRFWRPPLYQLSYARIARCYFIKRTRTQVEFLGVAATGCNRRNPRASAQVHIRSSRAKVQCNMKLMTQLRYIAGTVTSSSARRSNGISHMIGDATLSRIICIIAAAKKVPTGARYRGSRHFATDSATRPTAAQKSGQCVT